MGFLLIGCGIALFLFLLALLGAANDRGRVVVPNSKTDSSRVYHYNYNSEVDHHREYLYDDYSPRVYSLSRERPSEYAAPQPPQQSIPVQQPRNVVPLQQHQQPKPLQPRQQQQQPPQRKQQPQQQPQQAQQFTIPPGFLTNTSIDKPQQHQQQPAPKLLQARQKQQQQAQPQKTQQQQQFTIPAGFLTNTSIHSELSLGNNNKENAVPRNKKKQPQTQPAVATAAASQNKQQQQQKQLGANLFLKCHGRFSTWNSDQVSLEFHGEVSGEGNVVVSLVRVFGQVSRKKAAQGGEEPVFEQPHIEDAELQRVTDYARRVFEARANGVRPPPRVDNDNVRPEYTVDKHHLCDLCELCRTLGHNCTRKRVFFA